MNSSDIGSVRDFFLFHTASCATGGVGYRKRSRNK